MWRRANDRAIAGQGSKRPPIGGSPWYERCTPLAQLRAGIVRGPQEIDAVLASLLQKRASAFVLSPDPLFFTRRVQLVTLATRYGIPAIYTSREFAQVGGLMSYGPDLPDVWRQVGNYIGRILKGAKPGDLPVMQSTKLELVINLQTSRAFGLEIPPMLLARADEVIE